ncbi:MAG TPA: type II toxin-antitoxin system Phd/YefM family antitoxin [Gammaproteobacteria bacterium]|nr:type II toxin-antitoxin system Phd/YefM family antitoxin [Gammaproteobacteria bacterium]
MTTVNIHEAKTQLSRLLQRAVNGEEIIIAKAGRAVVKLVPVAREAGGRRAGMDLGKVRIADDFDAPLPEDVLRDFES